MLGPRAAEAFFVGRESAEACKERPGSRKRAKRASRVFMAGSAYAYS
jgi:hypothetical protein